MKSGIIRNGFVMLLVLAGVLFTAGTALFAEEPAGADVNMYVGDNAKTCKMCHKDQVAAWSGWEMSKSWDKLSDEEKLNDACVKCHVTGFGEPGGFVSFEETPNLVGIQCESCHGPAGNHMKVPMKDKEARAASMNEPDESNCLQCHIEEGNPNFKEFKYDEGVKALADHFMAGDDAAEDEVEEVAAAVETGEGEKSE